MSRPSFSLTRPLRNNSQPPPPSAHIRNESIERNTRRDRPASLSPRLNEGTSSGRVDRPQRVSRGMRRLEQRRTMEEQHYLLAKARAQNYNPPVDFRMLDYVSPYDDNLMCPICRCPFVDPVVLSECDHCFCRDCIRQCWNTNSNYTPLGPKGPCPTCRTSAKLGPRNAASKLLVNITDDLVVKCPKSEEGCEAEVKRGEIADHVSIYCGYALVECTGAECDEPVQRKDEAQGCLHYDVSCVSCHKEVPKWKLEAHWRKECPDRKVRCDKCKSSVYYRQLDDHNKQTCPALSIACPGQALGCTTRAKPEQLESHARNCTLAKLAPMMQKQQQRLDEQEAAQKHMSRKLEVLENGFGAIQGLLSLDPQAEEPVRSSTESSTTPTTQPYSPMDFEETVTQARGTDARLRPTNTGFEDLLGPVGLEDHEFDWTRNAPSTSPYTSPVNHLLSLHESLREEIARISTAISELDGRHSMQALNENLRTREEVGYLGAQLSGLQRQVHCLTSAQLQRVHGGGRSTPGGTGVGSSGEGGAGMGVEAAVSAVSSAARAIGGVGRAVEVGQSQQGLGLPMRRRASEEGRTKL